MPTRRMLATTAAAALSLSLLAAQQGATPQEATETVYLSAGCAPTTPGQCESTRWLGTVSGDATTNFLTATTPVDEAEFRATGAINWRDYPADASFGAYVLDADRDLGITVTLSSSATAGAGANVTVRARARLHLVDDQGARSTELVTADAQVITAMTTLDGAVPVEFALDLPAALDGRTLDDMTVEVAVHGVNVQSGYIDQQGGSPVTIPHVVVED